MSVLRLTGPLGTVLRIPMTIDPAQCREMAAMHRRISAALFEPCPDLLEVAQLWEDAAVFVTEYREGA
jgi:hypothetical protein